jgi:4-aminobutyrate aminotransferase / (S)-3-amino-2-methylpropionate transaminase / 5-aminovalerate transaminase
MDTSRPHTVAERYHDFVNLSPLAGIDPMVVDHAKGAVIWDSEGSQYVDCFAGISVVNSGHCHPAVIAAAAMQMGRLIHCGTYLYQVAIVGELAEKLAQITPGSLQKTFFCNSGAEAIEGAMRLAKAYTGRSEFIALQAGFHGRTSATLSVTGNRKRKQRGGPYLSGVAFAPTPHPYRCRFCSGSCTLACADAVEDVIDYETAGNVAAFIAEPLLGEGGILVPPDGYFERVKTILDRHGILLIVDEVQTGFGRTGSMFGIEHYGVEPDIMTLAKGIAAGFPLGAFIARPEVADSFQPGEHLSTFGGNPVACAAGLANIGVLIDEQLPQRARTLGEMLMKRLLDLRDKSEVVGDVRGRGLMIGIELVTDRHSKTPAAGHATRVKALARDSGVLLGVGGFHGNVIRIQPPLVIEEAQLDMAFEVLDSALGAVS